MTFCKINVDEYIPGPSKRGAKWMVRVRGAIMQPQTGLVSTPPVGETDFLKPVVRQGTIQAKYYPP